MKSMKVGDRFIGAGYPCFVIAEIGSNHDQKLEQAKDMIREAARCGADAVKFQSLNYDEINAYEDAELRSLFEKIKLDETWYPHLKKCADENGVYFFSAPCYLKAIEALEAVGVALYKIASPQTRGFPQLIRMAAKTAKPLIISTGYCNMEAIERAARICFKANNPNFALLHCVSLYPASAGEMNIETMDTLRARFDCPVGLSDHTLGTNIALAAVARGADIIEKHFTLDRNLSGPDHGFALEPHEFAELIAGIRDVQASFGNGNKKVLPLEEEIFEKNQLTYKILAARDITAGEQLQENILLFKRVPGGVSAEEEEKWRGKTLLRNIKKGEILSWSDFN